MRAASSMRCYIARPPISTRNHDRSVAIRPVRGTRLFGHGGTTCQGQSLRLSAAKTHRVRPHMMTHPHRTPTWLPAQQVGRREVIFSSAGGSLPADGGPTHGSGADGAAGASCGHQRPRRYEVLERARRFEGISCQPARPGRLLLWPLHWLVRRLQPDLWRTR